MDWLPKLDNKLEQNNNHDKSRVCLQITTVHHDYPSETGQISEKNCKDKKV